MDNDHFTQISPREECLTLIKHHLHYGNAALALAHTDLDNFAAMNATYGTAIGDRVLAEWESALARNLPDYGEVRRFGGDEYAILLPGFSSEQALILLEEIRSFFSSQVIEGGDRNGVSVGVASNPPHGSTPDELWRSAGEAMMKAKRAGGNRVAIYTDEKMVLKSNYYSRANLERLSKLSTKSGRTEASLLRESLDDLFDKYREQL